MSRTAEIIAPVIACDRLRIQTDGVGVTTLVCFHGCPLRCKWCLNPFSFDPAARRTDMTPRMLYQKVKPDELYFLATGGGVTFGGGEPLLHPAFLREFRALCGPDWHLCAETSLAVPWKNVEQAAACIDQFYVDVKDTNPDIYRAYTGRENGMTLENLEKLTRLVGPERIVVRLPLIPQFNAEADRQRSEERLTAIGLQNFDRFEYVVR